MFSPYSIQNVSLFADITVKACCRAPLHRRFGSTPGIKVFNNQRAFIPTKGELPIFGEKNKLFTKEEGFFPVSL